MSENILLLNNSAEKVKDLFLNTGITLKKIFNNVYSVYTNDIDNDVIVKCYDIKRFALREINNLTKLYGVKGVPDILTHSLSSKLKYIVMTKIKGVDLCEYIQNKSFTEDEVKNITIQILKILKRIHDKNIIHQDIKPENIIYNTETKKIGIIDFEGKYTSCYCSPEQVQNMCITDKTDLWSLGVTLYTIYTNSILFETKQDVLKGKIEFDSSFSYEFQDFLKCIIEKDVDLRYDVDDALEHTWLQ
jgi:serine/threonine protein kinase